MATFDTPEIRADFEERMGVLVEMGRTGRMRFIEGVGGRESISRVRYLPNGRVDFLSIDESARFASEYGIIRCQRSSPHLIPTVPTIHNSS
ncbi:hypothetical protein LOY67_14270 [Pseudomonas sp. B21-056]|jgi:hypothetical protein|uniref:AVAST type 1 anti-phage system protein Avs1c n=1 Tax=Pseudomonas sp. B21-056 TaxID=2895495 RepID=UPI002231483E|nr:AVAST type 1 anti-phage system protein Avs1c [Pseudomonas sp. B21-056]UZE21218.1 hypothetical protein LOY67_14270 [Pseudomonas sp. B21-056]